MKIHFITAWSNEKNIGKSYNESMEMIPDGDWVCFVDGDAMFSTKYWGTQLYHIIDKFPNAGCFTAMTNRVNQKVQLYKGQMDDDMSMTSHRKIGAKLQELFYDSTFKMKRNQPMSGVLMMVKKDVWKKVPFREQEKLAGVDNYFHYDLIDAGYHVHLMRGVYMIHWYDKDRKHLK